jgi:hypothetical protein
MQKGLKLNGQMRALGIALAGAVVTSVVAMFVPTGVWEAITGSTGISEIIPATAAPLGDTARAMIAFLFGALAFAVIAALLFRRPATAPFTKSVAPVEQYTAPVDAYTDTNSGTDTSADADISSDTSLFGKIRERLNNFVESRRAGPVVTELSDLPKLRSGDAHPDAPPRRPISAHTDFAEVPPPPLAMSQVTPDIAAPVEVQPEPLASEPLPTPSVDPVAVSQMVARLENAVAEREERLAKLESLAKSEIAKPAVNSVDAQTAETVKTEIVEPAPRASLLEAVPSEPRPTKSVDMDPALRSALETLHRMNARTR